MSEVEMSNQQQALSVLVQAAQVAQKRGAFDLNEASAVASAVRAFMPPESEDDTEDGEEVTSEESE